MWGPIGKAADRAQERKHVAEMYREMEQEITDRAADCWNGMTKEVEIKRLRRRRDERLREIDTEPEAEAKECR